MFTTGFSNQNSFIKLPRIIYLVLNRKKKQDRLIKIIVILCMAVSIPLFLSSCRTCKCPAYSTIEYENPVNSGVTTV